MNTTKKTSTKNTFLGFASNYELVDTTYYPTCSPLPFAIKEVSSTQEILGGSTYINEKARKNTFESHSEDANIIHLALHSQLNSTHPDQSALVFQSDTTYEYLKASEIYNMDLNADLTILSACNTAVGEINAGDGVRSITRSFIHAGSASVLTSLWEAPDVSTSQIIHNFYNELKSGIPKDVALRKAKIKYLENALPSYKHPKYWAHLILVGNTGAMQFSNGISSINLWIGGIILLLLLIGLILKWRNNS